MLNNKIEKKVNWKTNWGWNDIILDLDNEQDLINFYEKQKKTFWSKKLSSNWPRYFKKFINSFLQIENLSKRWCEVAWYLLRHLEQIDVKTYKNLLVELKNHKNYHQIMKEKYRSKNRSEFFHHIQTFQELKEEFEKYHTAFHHLSKEEEIIKNFYIPFIEKFIGFFQKLSKEDLNFALRAILLLELQAYKIDENFINYYKIEKDLSEENQLLLAEKSFCVRWVIKRWAYFFQNKWKEELLNYYKKVWTTFWRKDKIFFKEFIKALLKYKWTYDIDVRINTLISHLKKKDLDFKKFLNEINFDEKNLVLKKETYSKNNISEKRNIKLEKKWKIKKVKKKKLEKKEEIKKEPIIDDKKNDNAIKIVETTTTSLVKLINKLSIKSQYKKTISDLEKCLSNDNLGSWEIDLLLKKMKLNDFLNLVNKLKIKLSDKQKKDLYLKCLMLSDLFTLSENNFWVLKYLVENYSKNKEKDYLFLKKHLRVNIEKLRRKKI